MKRAFALAAVIALASSGALAAGTSGLSGALAPQFAQRLAADRQLARSAVKELEAKGYSDIRHPRRTDEGVVATASRDGQRRRVLVDPLHGTVSPWD